MSSTNKTPNLALNQWIPTDPFAMADFNADNAKLDEVLGDHALTLAGCAKVAAGTYTGNGAASRTISVGFTPKAVYVCLPDGQLNSLGNYSWYYGGLAVTDAPVCFDGTGTAKITLLEIVDGGFSVKSQSSSSGYSHAASNQSGKKFHYVALG